jgi:hypothetical protein
LQNTSASLFFSIGKTFFANQQNVKI